MLTHLCFKESCINASDLFRCIDGPELKEFVMQWFAPAGEILMHPQCVCYTLGWLQYSEQQKWQRFFFSMKAHLIWRSAEKLKNDEPGASKVVHTAPCTLLPASVKALHCLWARIVNMLPACWPNLISVNLGSFLTGPIPPKLGPNSAKAWKINIIIFQAALPKPDLKPDLPESLFNDLYQVPRCKITNPYVGVNIWGIVHWNVAQRWTGKKPDMPTKSTMDFNINII